MHPAFSRMQTPYSFGRFCTAQPRRGGTEGLNCLNKTRYYSTRWRPDPAKFFLVSRPTTLGVMGWEFSASGSRRLCGYTHSRLLTKRRLVGPPPGLFNGAIQLNAVGPESAERKRVTERGKRRRSLRAGDTTPTPKTYAEKSKSSLF